MSTSFICSGVGTEPKINVNNINKSKANNGAQLTEKALLTLRAAFVRNKIWPLGSIITVSFLSNVSQTTVNYVQSVVIGTLQPLVKGITIKFVNSNGIIRVCANTQTTGVDPGWWSQIGTDPTNVGLDSKATMNIGDIMTDGSSDRVILHEFGHVMGMIHEHQSPVVKPGDPPLINPTKAYAYYAARGFDKNFVDENILPVFSTNQLTGSVFDPESIMLYDIPSQITNSGIGYSGNYTYSELDKAWLRKVYPSPEAIAATNSPQTQQLALPVPELSTINASKDIISAVNVITKPETINIFLIINFILFVVIIASIVTLRSVS